LQRSDDLSAEDAPWSETQTGFFPYPNTITDGALTTINGSLQISLEHNSISARSLDGRQLKPLEDSLS
jgi:hypothetical protein